MQEQFPHFSRGIANLADSGKEQFPHISKILQHIGKMSLHVGKLWEQFLHLDQCEGEIFHVFSLSLVCKCNFINIHDNNQPMCRNHSSYMCKNYSSYTVEVNTSFGEMCPVTPGLHTQLVFCFFYCLFILEHVDCHC